MAKLVIIVHYPQHQVLDHLLPDVASCWLVSSATVFAIASMTSSASPATTLSDPARQIP